MNPDTVVAPRVNYIIDLAGKFLMVENVLARVCLATGERLFAPETMERLQQLAWQTQPPKRVVSTPVFEFA